MKLSVAIMGVKRKFILQDICYCARRKDCKDCPLDTPEKCNKDNILYCRVISHLAEGFEPEIIEE